jgi:16S rRNA (adenine1518-N6/adenine1519-N6)-dimethyltransferase
MFKPIKELGQNFLTDGLIARDMVAALNILSGEVVIEIGPGHGMLTEIVARQIRSTGSELVAVEIDERFVSKLERMFGEDLNIKIINQNILDFLPKYHAEKDFKILGSLPYYITSPIIHKIIKMETRPTTCVLLVQKEVAEKIANQAPDSSYMSSFVQTFYRVEYLFNVPSHMFSPKPEVDGGVIKLTKKETNFGSEFVEKFEGFLHKAYAHPRKMLNKVFTREELEKGGIKTDLRAQNLNADDWLEFYRLLNPEVIYEA